jgi:hypothetical protein
VNPKDLLVVTFLAVGSFAARDSSAETTPKTPVSVTVIGKGSIRLVVADGTARPCEVSDNHVLFDGHAKAGEEIKLASATGSVCVDHTYGAFRESQWAGASIWSGSGAGFSGVRTLNGSVSTDEP